MSGSISARPTLDEAQAVADPPYSEDHSRRLAREQFWATRTYRGYICPDCGRGLDRVYAFDVHHKDGNPHNNDPDNLVGLCRRCHRWRHDGSTLSGLDVEEWKEEFGRLGGRGP